MLPCTVKNWVYAFIIPLLTMILVVVIYASPSTKIRFPSPEEWSSLAPLYYASVNAKLNFDYPNGWTIEDHKFSSDSVDNIGGSNYTYVSLSTCPTEPNIIETTEEGMNNCIMFYTKFRIQHPVDGLEDERPIFEDFKPYIQDSAEQDYPHIRLMSSTAGVDNSSVNLTGVFRDGSNFVIMFQRLCASEKNAECVLRFKRVLDSIHFD